MTLAAYQQDFIQLSLTYQALRFGQFTLKSGRRSPYFFNAGQFNTGIALAKVGECYAKAILNANLAFDVLFGPAYKGIPLAVSTAIALAQIGNLDKPYCFNRKEVKDHGEGGQLVGATLKGKVLLIDDVITAGTAVRESVALINSSGAQLAGIVIAMNRQERGQTASTSAVTEINSTYKIPVISIITLDHLITYIANDPKLKHILPMMQAYRAEYGEGKTASALS